MTRLTTAPYIPNSIHVEYYPDDSWPTLGHHVRNALEALGCVLRKPKLRSHELMHFMHEGKIVAAESQWYGEDDPECRFPLVRLDLDKDFVAMQGCKLVDTILPMLYAYAKSETMSAFGESDKWTERDSELTYQDCANQVMRFLKS